MAHAPNLEPLRLLSPSEVDVVLDVVEQMRLPSSEVLGKQIQGPWVVPQTLDEFCAGSVLDMQYGVPTRWKMKAIGAISARRDGRVCQREE